MIPNYLIKQIKNTFEYSMDAIYIKDENCRFRFINQVGLNDLQLQEEDILSFSDDEISWSPYAEIYNQHDMLAMQGHVHSQLEISVTKQGEKLFSLSEKFPLKDEFGKTHGVLGFSKTFNYDHLIFFLGSKKQFELQNIKVTFDTEGLINTIIQLTTREIDVLYYFLRGKSVKVIAHVLNITDRTVIFHLNNIKKKWGCNSKDELFDKALKKGLMESSALWSLSSVTSYA